jgi:hypothetical protein
MSETIRRNERGEAKQGEAEAEEEERNASIGEFRDGAKDEINLLFDQGRWLARAGGCVVVGVHQRSLTKRGSHKGKELHSCPVSKYLLCIAHESRYFLSQVTAHFMKRCPNISAIADAPATEAGSAPL